jgi:hypothetical protein
MLNYIVGDNFPFYIYTSKTFYHLPPKETKKYQVVVQLHGTNSSRPYLYHHKFDMDPYLEWTEYNINVKAFVFVLDQMDLTAHVTNNTCTCVSIMWPLDSSLFLTPIYASLESNTQLERSKMGNIYLKTKICENNI